MPLTADQIATAQRAQHRAARDPSPQVRLVAGPGTGKSSSIEERVLSLLSQGVPAAAIAVVSFTRASAADLASRVHAYCVQQGQPTGAAVSISTLHSLALRALRAAGLLAQYPAEPLVLDDWEQENIFDLEFGDTSNINGTVRPRQIRVHHEAFWSTGEWGPPNYHEEKPPISLVERQAFEAFHRSRTQLYSCVLPGEIVRACVDNTAAGLLDPAQLLGVEHFIADEYQDLNPYDQRFIEDLITRGVTTFVAGDDDQSIYSFRYASPEGLQQFLANHPPCGPHTLNACFRCAPEVVEASQTLITAYATPNRIQKNLYSLYATAAPPLRGTVRRWEFPSGVAESRSIAQSCNNLIAAGLPANEIMILVANAPVLAAGICDALTTEEVPHQPPRLELFLDTRLGRWLSALLRIVCNPNDYVAHRTILGLPVGVGLRTANQIAAVSIINNANYRDLFFAPLPAGLFSGRTLNALNRARETLAAVMQWLPDNTLAQRAAEITTTISHNLSPDDVARWRTIVATLPTGTTLEELRRYVSAGDEERQGQVLDAVRQRLGEVTNPEDQVTKVRIMTMHGAKGLSARIVFVPGLEESILPGPRRRPYPGLVSEAARLLFVSITRARAACILSFARTRIVNGNFSSQTASRFCATLGGPFRRQNGPLPLEDVELIMQEVANLS